MGLDIHVKDGTKEYHYGYSALHQVRYLALLVCGFPTTVGGKPSWSLWPACYILPEGLTAEDLNKMTFALQVAGHHFPNLLLHQDCEGAYSRRGKVNTGTLESGNSIALLDELRSLKKSLTDEQKKNNERAVGVLNCLHDVVEEAVEKSDGRVEFH